jgi:demethylmenaquinone methyltransferase/2-methoxy-6-polyprenyl-1,4-benzoquinol methylase
MANVYYQPGDQRAARVSELFGRIAPRYDLINDLQSFGLHRWWKRRLVQLAQASPGQRALDLCCGTGDLAFALAKRGAQVVGLDFSEPMLDIARRRANKNSADKQTPPQFIRGDALHIPFPDSSFDIVTIGYGLRNLSDWQAGLTEMVRVAKPGARILVLDFGKPSNALWRSLYLGYLRLVVPLFGFLFCRDAAAYAYILESLKSFPAQRGIDDALRTLGCQDARVLEPLGGIMGLNRAVRHGIETSANHSTATKVCPTKPA